MDRAIIADLNRAMEENRSLVCVSVARVSGHSPASAGAKMLVFADSSLRGTIGGGTLEQQVIKKALELFRTRENCLAAYDLESGTEQPDSVITGMPCGGSVVLFFEFFGPAAQLLIFGGGHVGSALIRHARYCGFSLVCIDPREEIRNKIKADYEIAVHGPDDTVPPAELTFIVIAGHSHDQDFSVLRELLDNKTKAEYIGIVASSRKWRWMQDKLTELGYPENTFSRIYSPAGISSGGSDPDDIAVSILAEINSIRYKSVKIGHLRDLKKEDAR
ncbi:MAG: XdhC family protein [Spirochaetales bacterium]|nr:XdhC family protein [Spirochaetales bacterium]